jgi:hypothetical protein
MSSAAVRPFDRNLPRPQFIPQRTKTLNTKILSAAELLNLASPEWLIADTLPERGLAVMYGPPDSYKSFVALDFALHVAAGQPWQGRPVKAGNVLYVLGEGSNAFGRRVRAWLLRHQHTEELIQNAGFLPSPVQFLEDASLSELSSLIDRWKPAQDGTPLQLVVIDTLATCFVGGDENKQEDMTRFINSLRSIQAQRGAAILLLHHTGKDPEKGERGSSVLIGAADTRILVKRAAPLRASLECKKQKDAERFSAITVALTKVPALAPEEGVVSLALDNLASAPAPPERTLKTLALEALAKAPDLLTNEWRLATIHANGGDPRRLSENNFRRLQKELRNDGLVTQEPVSQRYRVVHIPSPEQDTLELRIHG